MSFTRPSDMEASQMYDELAMLSAENADLRRQLAKAEREAAVCSIQRDEAKSRLTAATRRADEAEAACAAMRSIVEEVAGAGVSFSDPRVKYIEVQLSAKIQEEAKAALASDAGRAFLDAKQAAEKERDELRRQLEKERESHGASLKLLDEWQIESKRQAMLAAHQAAKEKR